MSGRIETAADQVVLSYGTYLDLVAVPLVS